MNDHKTYKPVGIVSPPVLKALQETYQEAYKHESYHLTRADEKVKTALHPFVLNAINIPTVLDIGCGTGKGFFEVKKLLPGAEVYGLDIVKLFTEQTHVAAAWEMPFKDKEIFLGLCLDVMEHIPPDYIDRTLEEIKRVCVNCFFAIPTTKDKCGPTLLGRNLHLTVRDINWWDKKIRQVSLHPSSLLMASVGSLLNKSEFVGWAVDKETNKRMV